MILEQIYLGCLSQASYLIGDADAGIAAVVDPRRDVDVYLAEASRRGLSIRHVILTHFHADFVAGHLELRERVGATIHLGARARAEYAFEPLREGDEIALGRVRLRALETPGHTPEGISLLVLEGDDPAPRAVLTGDTLFIGDVGRPDLMASQGTSAEELAADLYDSTRRLCELPDATLVYPGHGAGSACGKSLSKETVSTIGDQRRLNYALQPMTKAEFIALVTAFQPPVPAYFGYDADLNRSERAVLDAERAGGRALPFAEVERELERGALLLDVRDPEEFAAGHLAGSLSIGLDGRFASWAGTVLGHDVDLIVLAPAGREREAAVRLARIGYDRVLGHLAGGIGAVPAERLARVQRYDPPELAEALARRAVRVLDVREPGERAEGAIPGSLFLSLSELPRRLGDVPADQPLVVQCAGGYRSMIAASLLEHAGGTALGDLRAGMGAWRRAGLPVMVGEGATTS